MKKEHNEEMTVDEVVSGVSSSGDNGGERCQQQWRKSKAVAEANQNGSSQGWQSGARRARGPLKKMRDELLILTRWPAQARPA